MQAQKLAKKVPHCPLEVKASDADNAKGGDYFEENADKIAHCYQDVANQMFPVTSSFADQPMFLKDKQAVIDHQYQYKWCPNNVCQHIRDNLVDVFFVFPFHCQKNAHDRLEHKILELLDLVQAMEMEISPLFSNRRHRRC